MVKTISISGKQYDMHSSVYTAHRYKNDTGRNLMKDIKDLTLKFADDDKMMDELDTIIERTLYLAYIMIQEANHEFSKSFENWIRELDDLISDPSWMLDVLDLGMSPFRSRAIDSSATKR